MRGGGGSVPAVPVPGRSPSPRGWPGWPSRSSSACRPGSSSPSWPAPAGPTPPSNASSTTPAAHRPWWSTASPGPSTSPRSTSMRWPRCPAWPTPKRCRCLRRRGGPRTARSSTPRPSTSWPTRRGGSGRDISPFKYLAGRPADPDRSPRGGRRLPDRRGLRPRGGRARSTSTSSPGRSSGLIFTPLDQGGATFDDLSLVPPFEHLRVVGIVAEPGGLAPPADDATTNLWMTPAAAAAYGDAGVIDVLAVQLEDGADGRAGVPRPPRGPGGRPAGSGPVGRRGRDGGRPGGHAHRAGPLPGGRPRRRGDRPGRGSGPGPPSGGGGWGGPDAPRPRLDPSGPSSPCGWRRP